MEIFVNNDLVHLLASPSAWTNHKSYPEIGLNRSRRIQFLSLEG